MRRDPDDEYFSDGLVDEIINALAQVLPEAHAMLGLVCGMTSST